MSFYDDDAKLLSKRPFLSIPYTKLIKVERPEGVGYYEGVLHINLVGGSALRVRPLTQESLIAFMDAIDSKVSHQDLMA